MNSSANYVVLKGNKFFIDAIGGLPTELRKHGARHIRGDRYMCDATHLVVDVLTRHDAAYTPEALELAKKLREDLNEYQARLAHVPRILSKKLDAFKTYDYTPKLPPMEHQRVCVSLMLLLRHMALFMDCGTGKTATTLMFLELLQEKYLKRPVKALVVGKLATLYSGWADDCKKFTDLSCEVFWEPQQPAEETIIESVTLENTNEVQEHLPGARMVSRSPGDKLRDKTVVVYKDRRTGGSVYLKSAAVYDPRKHLRYRYKWRYIETPTNIVSGSLRRQQWESRNVRRCSLEERIVNSNANVHIVNHEGAILLEEAFLKVQYDAVIIDESTVMKNPEGATFKALKHIGWKAPYRFILTGTPAANGAEDLWAQLFWLDRGLTLGDGFNYYREQYFEAKHLRFGPPGGKNTKEFTKYITTEDTINWVRSRLEGRHYQVYLRDCVDLPPLTDNIIDVYLTPEQQKAYGSMQESLLATIGSSEVVAKTTLTKLLKLQQITGGFVQNEGEVMAFKENPKLDELKSLVTQLLGEGEQVVIFAVFTEEILAIRREFPAAGAIYGDVQGQERFDYIRHFMDGKIRVIVCQPQAAAHGLTFVNARHLVFYSKDYSAERYYQAVKRIERTGQKRAMFVHHLMARKTIDIIIHRVVAKKQEVQGMLIGSANPEAELLEAWRQDSR